MAAKKPKYELEDLLKVRETIKDTAEVVRKISNSECGDHILRSSSNSTLHQRRLRTSSIVTNPYEDIPSDNVDYYRGAKPRRAGRFSKYSPTPSIKRGKAERLLKEHASPPGIRVTAGGRIVPDGLSPLTSPRFDHGAQFKPGLSNRPHGFPTYLAPKPLNGFVVDLGNGSFGQVIDGLVRPVEERNGMLHLYMPAPNLPIPPIMPFAGIPTPAVTSVFPQPPGIPAAAVFEGSIGQAPTTMPTAREIRVMEQVHSKLEQDLKDLNRNEVLQRGSLNASKRHEIVKSRVALTERIDQSRRAITDAKKLVEASDQATQQNPASNIYSAASQHNPMLQVIGSPGEAQQFTYDSNGFLIQPGLPHNHGLLPELPEFVPRNFNPVASDVPNPSSEVLQERVGNANLVSSKTSTRDQGSNGTTKGSIYHGNGGMGLDGSVHHHQQPRRSHAVAIKDPNDKSVIRSSACAPSNSAPDLQPDGEPSCNDLEHSGLHNFVPSPTIVAQMDDLVKSPNQDEPQLHQSFAGHQRSDSSVNTDDFFPGHAAEHSSSRFISLDRHVDGDGRSWMPKEGEPTPKENPTTPSRLPNKFVFNDDSPAERFFANVADAVSAAEEPSTQRQKHEESSQPSHMRENTVTSGDEPLGLGITGGGLLSQTAEQAGQRAATLPSSSPRKSDTYWEGYRTGIQQDIMGDNKDEDFRVGYRDGLLRSSFAPNSAPISGYLKGFGERSPPAMYAHALRDERGDRIPSLSKRPSFHSFSENSAPISPIPGVPSNSLATTPTQSTTKERSQTFEKGLDSPSARADFMSQPNVNIRSSSVRIVGTRTSNSMLHDPQAASPLAKRRLGRSTPAELSYVPAPMKGSGDIFDNQRYRKSAAVSVVQTNHHARGSFQQYDGSADDDDKVLAPASANAQPLPPTSPSSRSDRGKAPASPMKRRTSAAVATMKQVAGIAAKKDESKKEDASTKKLTKKEQQDPAKMSSPEKKQWREKWAKNFRQLKKEEQEEIEQYKRAHPAQ